jgi:hypothetical protein
LFYFFIIKKYMWRNGFFFIIKKYMWRNGFFNLSNAIEEYGVFKSEEGLRAWQTTRPVHRKTSTLFN